MKTTDRFKDLAEWFVNYINVYNAIEILTQEGVLTEIKGDILGNYIIAL
jgi:hypothetical protein